MMDLLKLQCLSILALLCGSPVICYNIQMKDAVTQTSPNPERIPDPSFDESKLSVEVEENRKRNIDRLRQLLEGTDDEPQLHQWLSGALKEIAEMDTNGATWILLHEFAALLPEGHLREIGLASAELQRDLDRLLGDCFDYDRYVELQRRKDELTVLERRQKILPSERQELLNIGRELGQIDIGRLYIGMRRLGYSPAELRTKRGGKDSS
jgi:hypothetical protein